MCVFEKENTHRQQGTEMLFSLRCLLNVQGCAAGISVCDAWQRDIGTKDMFLLSSDMSHSVTGLDRQYEVNPPEMGQEGTSYSKRR